MKPYRYAYLEVTNRCNRRCSFCPECHRQTAFVDLSAACDWLDQIAELSEAVYFHVLGEPLLHPDLEAMVRHAAGIGLQPCLTTNASFLARHAGWLAEKNLLHQINFSLQSLREVPDSECERVWQDVLNFTRRVLAETPELYVNYRWWQDAAPDRSRAVVGLGIPDSAWQAPPGRHRKRITGRLYATYDATFAWPEPTTETQTECSGAQGGCRALLDHFAILADGRVTACCLDAEGNLAFGNAHMDRIAALLHSPEAVRMAEGFRRKVRVAPLCRNCGYATRFQ